MAIAEWLKRRTTLTPGDAGAGLAPAPFYDGGRRTLAADCRSPTIHLGLGDLARSDQRRDTCVVQLVAVPAHTIFQAPGFEPPLATEPAIIVCTMTRVSVSCPRHACQQSKQRQQAVLPDNPSSTNPPLFGIYMKASKARPDD